MKEFIVAAERAADLDPDGTERLIEIPIKGQEPLVCRIPTTAQLALLYSTRGGMAAQMSACLDLLRANLLDDGIDRIEKWLRDGVIDIDFLLGGDDSNEEGLINAIISEAAGRPTEPPTGSTPSPKPTGGRSTGRVRGAASTPSSSPQTAS